MEWLPLVLRSTAEARAPPVIPPELAYFFSTSTKEFDKFRELWKEVAILGAFLRKERRVFRPTPYFAKLTEVFRLFKKLDDLRIEALADWFLELSYKTEVPSRQAFSCFLQRIIQGLQILEKVFVAIRKAANYLLDIASLGHHAWFVTFCITNIATIRADSFGLAAQYKAVFNRGFQLIDLLPADPNCPATYDLPDEIDVHQDSQGIVLELDVLEEGPNRVPLSQLTKYSFKEAAQKLISVPDAPECLTRNSKRRKKVDTERKLSLFDQMQYSESPKRKHDWTSWFVPVSESPHRGQKWGKLQRHYK